MVCEELSDAAAQNKKKPALANYYRDCSLGRELCAAPMQIKKRFAKKSPL